MNNEIEKLVERLNEAYDKIEKLEYRVVELENKIKDLKKPLNIVDQEVILTTDSGMQYIGTNEDSIKMYLA